MTDSQRFRRIGGGSERATRQGPDYLSLRYAHLAPDQRRVAVAKLSDYPVLALTLRLPWEGCRRCGAILLILWWKGRDSNPDPGIMSSDTPKACCQAQL